jgi:hypothetical protein
VLHLRTKDDLKEAERLASAACDQQLQDWQRNAVIHSGFLRVLAEVHMEMGKLEDAQRELEEAEVMVRREVGVEHYSYANVQLNIAKLLIRMANWEESRKCLNNTIAVREKVLGKDSPMLTEPLQLMTMVDAGTKGKRKE